MAYTRTRNELIRTTQTCEFRIWQKRNEKEMKIDMEYSHIHSRFLSLARSQVLFN